MNNVLQAYNVMASPTPDDTPHAVHQLSPYPLFLPCCTSKTSPNKVHLWIEVPMVDLQDWKCTVTGIDQHLINGLDIVQCAALVTTNHGYVNLLMNEYTYYGKVIPSTLHIRLNGIRTWWMINLSKWEAHSALPL